MACAASQLKARICRGRRHILRRTALSVMQGRRVMWCEAVVCCVPLAGPCRERRCGLVYLASCRAAVGGAARRRRCRAPGTRTCCADHCAVRGQSLEWRIKGRHFMGVFCAVRGARGERWAARALSKVGDVEARHTPAMGSADLCSAGDGGAKRCNEQASERADMIRAPSRGQMGHMQLSAPSDVDISSGEGQTHSQTGVQSLLRNFSPHGSTAPLRLSLQLDPLQQHITAAGRQLDSRSEHGRSISKIH